MNWRNSMWASDNWHAQGRFPKREKLTQRLVPYLVNKGYACNPRHYARMIYMLSQYKDAIANPAARIERLGRLTRELKNLNFGGYYIG